VIGHHRLLYLMRALRMLRLLKVRERHPGPAPRPRAPPGALSPTSLERNTTRGTRQFTARPRVGARSIAVGCTHY
jgi:hypothetical protein